ncbi:MAG: vanadium-dependent haloperoxidase [Winogradskyella sp.]|uniref:vanadium-dependent haloperoxidase n=1 Tax=Winogradskyella sp. TaxID=1883156 RepID=UPI00180AEC1C|nr:vanadium-dependent haloperoxidase [Winogradskyella sp.]MBT8245798.1 vanadium-dependent haloperoxidase [Winogradskyella sp.]NNK22411.1 vanadium-dependent haloperoxidase [Winogradskyella sp.]
MKFRLLVLFIAVILSSCKEELKSDTQVFQTSDLNNANTVLLEAVMEDAFTPPVASRMYAYAHLAHYITIQSLRKDSLNLITNKINGLEQFKISESKNLNPELSALLAFSNVGKKLIYSEHFFENLNDSLITKATQLGLTKTVIKNSENYAANISAQLSDWIDKDMYTETRTFSRFTSTKKPENWRETPPDYTTGLEPHWDNIRTMVIDSANVFKYKPLPKYSTDEDSDFYKMVYQVYEAVNNKTEDTEKTAWFWDCNPIMTVHTGHMVTTIHKFTPPGHWLNIVNQVSTKEYSDYYTTTKAYTLTSMAMFDAIIAAWHVKYRTDLVRPVTYIQENIDAEWTPVLQTPPFPEYTSGHSATSASAAEVLSSIYGENYAFTDNTQLRFGLEDRTFNSFREAANQVNMSRFYGGIHYIQGVEEGARQGREIANTILKKLR